MKPILIILTLFFIFSCQKDVVAPTDTGNNLRVVDITPQVYYAMRGNWHRCTSASSDVYYDFRVHYPNTDSLIVSVFDKSSQTITARDTIIYKLARDYNIDIITGYRLRDSSNYFENWEIRTDNTFWIGIYPFCR